MEITITGDVPSKKNSRQLFVRGGRIVNIPNKKYREWLDSALKQFQSLKNASHEPLPIAKADLVSIEIIPSNKRKFDLDNRLGSIMDFLVDSGVLKDDDYSVVPRINIYVGEIEKNSGYCKIFIEYQK